MYFIAFFFYFILDCQKCFHTDCISVYKTLFQPVSPSSSSLSGSGVKYRMQQRFHRLSGDSSTDEFKAPDISSIENCSFYSSESSSTCSINIVSYVAGFKSFASLFLSFKNENDFILLLEFFAISESERLDPTNCF